MFFVVLRRTGPEWDASRPLEEQSGWTEHAAFMDGLVELGLRRAGRAARRRAPGVLVVAAESEDAVRATLARDPWDQTHLVIDSVDAWTIRLDGRRR